MLFKYNGFDTNGLKVKVPLIGGMLEKHAEGEIRKFSQIELDIVEDELRQNLHAETLS